MSPNPTPDAATGADERVLVITQIFDAPPSLVFKAWTDPASARRWAGPRGFTATHMTGEVRPGGAWRTCLRRDETGEELWQGGVYREVVEPERLAFTFAWDDETGRRGHETLVTISFADHQGKTKMIFRQATFESVAQRDGHRGGWSSAFERLGEELAQGTETPPGDTPFVISRVFDAPRDLVWSAYTERRHLMQWWGPKGFKMLECTIDLRPGGIFHYGMEAPNGGVMWGKWIFREIVKPERLVVVVAFSDAAGGITRHPFAPDWPLETLSTTQFTEHEDKTTITMRWVALNATAAGRKAFDAAHDGMRAGCAGTFDQLADYLARARDDQ